MSEKLTRAQIVLARMEVNRRRGRGIRLSLADLDALAADKIGEWMTADYERATTSEPAPVGAGQSDSFLTRWTRVIEGKP